MYKGIVLTPPLFEIGLKGYLYGKEALELARAADRLSQKYGVTIIFDPQYVDIPIIARETQHLLVFAQHMDPVQIGRGAGAVLPEALKAAGAVGVMLNHVERRLTLSDIARNIQRADEVGLCTLVCADSPSEAAAIAQLGPNMILAEPPELIGTGRSVARENRAFVSESMRMVKKVDPEIIVFNAAGIRTAEDVADVIRAGAEATGTSSGILKADDPIQRMEEMIAALKHTWQEMHPARQSVSSCGADL
jgi:triosephosphate isomerase (TIM)